MPPFPAVRLDAARLVPLLLVFGLMLGIIILMFLWAVVGGTDGMTVSFGTGQIKNPALWQVAAVAVPYAVVVGVPFAMLMSERARRQFSASTSATVDAADVAARLSKVR